MKRVIQTHQKYQTMHNGDFFLGCSLQQQWWMGDGWEEAKWQVLCAVHILSPWLLCLGPEPSGDGLPAQHAKPSQAVRKVRDGPPLVTLHIKAAQATHNPMEHLLPPQTCLTHGRRQMSVLHSSQTDSDLAFWQRVQKRTGAGEFEYKETL